MNILITLPKDLIEAIISGQKKYQVSKSQPKYMRVGEDGFYVVEKGTDKIRCWCRVDEVTSPYISPWYMDLKRVYVWKIGKVKVFDSLKRDPLLIKRNPQNFAYCPLSYGESY